MGGALARIRGARCPRDIREIAMKRVVISAVLFCLLAGPAVPAADKHHNKVLNNLVSELMNVREQGLTGKEKIDFVNPRRGWCYFVISGDATVRLNDEKDPLVAGKAAGESAEAMRRLPAGRHTLYIKGRPSDLIVRAIPVLQHAFYGANPHIRPYGPYDWEFLKKDVRPNVNVMIGARPKAEHIKEWTDAGRSWITTAPNPFRGRDDVTVDEAYESWASGVGLNAPLMDGIIIDEFGGGDQPKYAAFRKAVERIYANPKFKGRTYSPYSYGSGILSNDLSRDFARACIAGGGYVCIERYLVEQPTRQAAESHIHEKMTSGWNMPRYEKDLPGVARGTVMVLGYMSQPTESLNVNPGVDFKVYMDMQMRKLATEPSFSGLGGIQHYHSGYADEETVRWAARLNRHYGIEGKTNLLSDELGYKYNLDHVQNPDFADGTKGWRIEAAEPGSIAPKTHSRYGYLQMRYWKDGTGDTFLWTKRSAEKANVFSQEIKNLKPGRLYSLKMITGDYSDLVRERQNMRVHGVSINIENVEMLSGEKDSFQFIFHNHHTHQVGKFGLDHRRHNYFFYMNYHWRVFRAKGTTAGLAVSDWKRANEPGGPVGGELIYNFIEIQPYLED